MLERIAEVADQLRAFQTVTAEEADLASRGHVSSAAYGPLAGVPTAIKDLNATKGVRTTFGSRRLRRPRPRLRRRGRPADRGGRQTARARRPRPSPARPATPSPRAPPGGDPQTPPDGRWFERGAAAAASAGPLPVAKGSDGGGSIRIPASCCASWAEGDARADLRAPLYGDLVGLATNGSLARTVRDAAARST